MKLVLASDIHLEKSNCLEPVFSSEGNQDKTLALLGDIGLASSEKYEEFIGKCVNVYKFGRIFVIAGNHEFYGSDILTTKERISSICSKYDNVTFLDKTSLLLDEGNGQSLRILGCTLWSNIDEKHSEEISQNVNDYKNISIIEDGQSRLFKTTDATKLHLEEVEWLTKEIIESKSRNETVVVLTHHAPLTKQTSDPRFKNCDLKTAFSSDLLYLIDRNRNINVWAFGHTHFNCKFMKKKTLIVTNQLGYRKDKVKSGFDTSFCLEVPYQHETSN